MAARNLGERVSILEGKVSELQDLPARMSAVESQIVQLRAEMHEDFSGLRNDLRGEIRQASSELATQMRLLHEEVIARIALLDEGRH